MDERTRETITGEVEEEAIETTGVTGTTAPSEDSDAPAIEEVMGSQIPGVVAVDQDEPDE